jgi:septal ring factor EnvC (AmiA/AmiB activator)
MTSLKTIFIAGLLLACAGWMTADARGNELLSTAEQKAETQLEEALRALGKQRDAIAAERLPLVRDLQEREARVMEKRRELARLQQARDNRDVALNLLKENISAREGQLDYIRSITSDFIRSTDASLHLAEAPL